MIAYLTFDEVNASVAAGLARRSGTGLRPITAPDQLNDGEVLVYDLDHLPREWRADLLRRAAAGRWTGEIAVHSYHLTATEVRVLRSAGVRVSRRLTAGLLAERPVTVAARFARGDGGAAGTVAV